MPIPIPTPRRRGGAMELPTGSPNVYQITGGPQKGKGET